MDYALTQYFSKRGNDMINNFRKNAEHYSRKPKNERLFPYAPYDVCFHNHKDEIMEALNQLIIYYAKQDAAGVNNFAYNIYSI